MYSGDSKKWYTNNDIAYIRYIKILLARLLGVDCNVSFSASGGTTGHGDKILDLPNVLPRVVAYPSRRGLFCCFLSILVGVDTVVATILYLDRVSNFARDEQQEQHAAKMNPTITEMDRTTGKHSYHRSHARLLVPRSGSRERFQQLIVWSTKKKINQRLD